MTAPVNRLMEHLYQTGGGRQAPDRFGSMVLAASVDKAEAVLRNPDIFHKDYGALGMLFTSRLNTDGAEWQLRRAQTQPLYHGAAGSQGRQRVIDAFEDVLSDAEREAPPPGEPLARQLSLAVVRATCRIFFEVLGGSHDTDALVRSLPELRRLVHAMEATSLAGMSRPGDAALRRASASVHADLRAYVSRHPSVGALVDRLDEALDAGAGLGELLGNFLAGAESTANTLRWAMRMVAHHPDVQETMRAEVAADGERPVTQTFLNEVLRCFPPLPLTTRRATQDFSTPALQAKKGEVILLSIVGVHMDPEHWHNPRSFEPERSEFRTKTFNRRAFIPFLYGPRVCGGAGLAQAELVEGLAALLRRFRFREVGHGLPFQYAASLRPVLRGILAAEKL